MARQQTQKTHEEHITEIWKIVKEHRLQTKELDRQIKESRMESDRQIKESRLETERQIKESRLELDQQMKETDRQMKETDKRLKKLDELFNGQWGKLMESLIRGDLVKLLRQKGIKVERTLTNITNESQEEPWEFDIIAVNGKEIVIVEVKTSLGVRDVKYFLKKLSKIKQYLREYKDRVIYGAVAYLKKQTGVDVFAEKEGLFVIRATGSSASITNKKSFKPKSFS